MYERTRGEGFGPEVKRRIMIGTYALSAGYYDAYYGRAQRVRTLVREDFARAFGAVDLIASPTSPTVAFKAGSRVDDPLAMYLCDVCTIPTNLAGLPAISIPCGLSDGLPVGFQLIGPAFSENRILEAAHALEAAIGFDAVPAFRDSGTAAPQGWCPEGADHLPPRGRAVMSTAWEPVIGLEMHVELDTRTKMFCGCEVTKGDEPNMHTCPVCLAHPGALPVVNQRAIEYAARIALALNCTVQPRSIFHRKNYFYPDLPKAYQISQYDEPLASDGWFEYWSGGERLRCRINRVHMEEDAAKLVHAGGETGRIAGSDYSMVDFNRGGTPLIEIVTEPDIPSPEAAREFLQQLRNLVVELGVSECNMEEGQVRWDANVSVRPEGAAELGTRTELKNMNSFRYLQQALDAEIPRQIEIIEAGGTIDLETLHFDPDTGTTTPLRSKEEAHDYRYFPEPDLVPVLIEPGVGGGAARDAAGAAGGARGALHRAVRPVARRTRSCWAARTASPSTTRRSWGWGPRPSRRPTGSWASTSPISTPPASRPATGTSPPSASPSSSSS